MGSIFKRKAFKNHKDKPWMIAYTDENGIRKVITGSTDKTVTKEILRAREADVDRRKHGLVSAADERFAKNEKKSIVEHINEYIAHCIHQRMSEVTICVKKAHLGEMIEFTQTRKLSEINPDSTSRFLEKVRTEGNSARTVNHYRSNIVAFVNWCVKQGRLPDNPIASIPKLNEEEDRRRIRRALTDAEFARLLEVAAEQDVKNRGRFVSRYAVYLMAALTGLRRNELKQITWADIDLGTQTLRVRVKVGKSKREDFVPLHDQLIETLAEMGTPGG